MGWDRRPVVKRRGLGSSLGARAQRPSPRTRLPRSLRGFAAPLSGEILMAEQFRQAFARLDGLLDIDAVLARLAEGDYGALLDLVDWQQWETATVESITEIVKTSIEREGWKTFDEVRTGGQALTAADVRAGVYGTSPPKVPPSDPGVPAAPSPRSGGFYGQVRFDMTNPFAIAHAESSAASLVREVSRSTRRAIQDAVVDSFRSGVTVDELARRLRNTVGLTSRQAGWVENYRARLLAQDMDPDRVEVLTRRYWRKTRNRRTQTIARTEIMRSSNFGRAQAWHSAADHGLLDPNACTKEWITAPELSSYGPPCSACLPMDGVKVTGMDGLFELPNGQQMSMPPAHPNCRCTAVVWPPEIPASFEPPAFV